MPSAELAERVGVVAHPDSPRGAARRGHSRRRTTHLTPSRAPHAADSGAVRRRWRQPEPSWRSRDVVDGDGAEQLAGWRQHTASASMSYWASSSATSRSVASGSTTGSSLTQWLQLGARRLAKQSLDVGRAEQAAGRCLERWLADEDLGCDADHPVGVAELGERLGHPGRRAEDDDLGRHHAARGARLVGEQAAEHVGLLVIHGVEDPAPAARPRHLAEQVGEVVVLHLVEHVDQPVEIEPADEVDLLGLGELLEHVGQPLVVHRGGELAAPGQGERANDVGHLGRVEVAQAGGLGGHLAGRGEQAGHLVGVDQAIARLAAQQVALDEADLGDLPVAPARVVDGAQADVADRLVADAAVEQVGADEDLTGLGLERVEVDVPALQAGAVARQFGDAVGVDEDSPPLAFGDEPDDARRIRALPGRPGTTTMSWMRPIGAPPASSSGRRITLKA